MSGTETPVARHFHDHSLQDLWNVAGAGPEVCLPRTTKGDPVANDIFPQVRALRQIRQLSEKGGLEGVKREARMAIRLCDDDPSLKGMEGGK